MTEDNEPVDHISTEKQQRFLTEPLYSSWSGHGEDRSFLALANVGWFYSSRHAAVVPDVLLSLGVQPTGDLQSTEGRSYFQWLIGKPPDLVLEIVSDRTGGEEHDKWQLYIRQGVHFYVIYDPGEYLKHGVLRAYTLHRGEYEAIPSHQFPELGLGLTLWEGTFEGQQQTWLRWCDLNGTVIPTGAERARAEHQQADEDRKRAQEADDKARKLAAQLRALGIEPEE